VFVEDSNVQGELTAGYLMVKAVQPIPPQGAPWCFLGKFWTTKTFYIDCSFDKQSKRCYYEFRQKIMNNKIKNYKFFNPTKALREYLLLEAISRTNSPSQRELSQAAGISPSVANKYLGEFEEDGLLRKEPLNKRDYQYRLTEKGEKVKRELMIKYIRETFQMFSEGKSELSEKLQNYREEKGFNKIIFYSAGEVTELLIHSLNGADLTLQAIADDDQSKQGKELFGYPVISKNQIKDYDPDAVIVTTFQYREKIIEKLKAMDNRQFEVIGF